MRFQTFWIFSWDLPVCQLCPSIHWSEIYNNTSDSRHLIMLLEITFTRNWEKERYLQYIFYTHTLPNIQPSVIRYYKLTSSFFSCSICFMCFAMTVIFVLWSSFKRALSSFWLRAKSENWCKIFVFNLHKVLSVDSLIWNSIDLTLYKIGR